MEEESKQPKPRYRKDGREVVPWRTFGASDFVNPYGLCVKKKPRERTPEYDKPKEGCAIIEPKVNEPFEAIPRRIVRKDLLKKIRELFNKAEINHVLKSQYNIDFSIPDQSRLNLPFFDDSVYQIYPNELWLAKAKDKHTGRQLKLMAKILIFNESNKTASWHRGMVVSYDKETDTFSGTLDNEEKTPFEKLSKLQILFDAENPYIYAKRLSEAVKLRSKCESKIKYNYYLHKIPTHLVTELPIDRMDKVKEKVATLPELSLVDNEIEREIKSVHDDYVFQLNKMMFDELYFKQKSVELCCINLKVDPIIKEPVPEFAKEMIYKENKEFDYQKKMKSFNLTSLQTKKNIINGLFKIKSKINRIIEESKLYQTIFPSTVRLDEFLKEQKKTITDFKKKIDNDISTSIKGILRDLEYHGNKGEEVEYDDDQKKLIELAILIDFIVERPVKARKQAIEADRLRDIEHEKFMIKLNNYKTIHLLKKINLMFRDALYNTVIKSMINFVSFFEMNVPKSTQVINTNTVANIYESPIAEKSNDTKIINIAQSRLEFNEESAFYKSTITPDVDLNTTYEIIDYLPEDIKTAPKIPIFYINLRYKEGAFDYHAQVEDFVIEIRKVFDEGLDKIQKITQLIFDKENLPSNIKYFDIIKRDKSLTINAQKKDEKNPNDPMNKTGQMNASMTKMQSTAIVGNDQNDQGENKGDKYNDKKEDSIFVNDLYERLGKALMEAKEPLAKYLNTFQQYKNDLDINPEEFVKGLDDDQAQDSSSIVQLLRNDIIKRQNLHDKILNEISEQVQVSYFLVNTKDVRDSLLSKHEKIRELELSLLNTKSQEIKSNVFKQIDEIKNGITKQSKNIEELVEIEKYIEDVPNMLASIKLDIDSCLQIYKISDEFLQKVQYMDFKTRFMLIQSTTEIANTITSAKTHLNKQRERFFENLTENQKVLKEDIIILQKEIMDLMNYKTIDQLMEASALSKACEAKLKDCQERAKLANSREVNFNKEQTDYSRLGELFKDFEPFYLIWTSIDQFESKSQEYINTDLRVLKGIEVQEMNDNVKKNLVLSIKKLKDREGYERIIQTAEGVKVKTDHFANIAKIAVSLTTEGLQDRHWNELKDATTIDCTDPANTMTLNMITNSVSLNNEIISQAQGIADKASREFQIKRKLVELDERWKAIEFVLIAYRIKGVFIIGGWGDIYKDLDNDVQEVQQLEVNQFKAHFIDEISDWSKSFQNITDILEALSKLQSKWVQLQPIFESPDIMKSIPHYATIFSKADKSYKDIVRGMKDSTNVKVVCNKEGLLVKIEESNEWLEQVEKGLNDYIDKKKLLFPRFYFLSNENLLKILSETKDLNRVKENLKNIFENIHNIELKDDKHILKMISNLGEEVPLKESISIERKNIEKWMLELEEIMFMTVRQCMERAISSYNRPPTKDWIFGHSGQSVVHSNQNHWTVQVEESLEKGTIASYCDEIQARINLLVTILREPLTRVKGITVFNLLTLEVHNKEITELFRVGDFNIFSFEWKKQLRYYWERNDMYVKSIQTSFPYGYEYLGNTEILVITPLTDKCYLTLMGALKFNMGGAPAGPAGTGKTESTKDLAKAIAKQCVVYNCSEETDFVAVAAFFKGLACCGAWICFDEFNRINIEVLSVIASQLIVLFTAKAAGEEKIVFEKTPIRILPTFCVFITMNPDYEGRTALPDNLVALFRPMAMMVPDYKLISEVYLYSSGYLMAKDLAKKIVSTFKLSSEQLSSQSHYDFGMRAVKSVLYAAKKLKINQPDIPEDKLLLRALQDVNIPKFLKEDIPLFTNIIKDLFPKTEKPTSDLGALIEKLQENCVKEQLQPHENFIGKIIQLYDTIQVRHGLMIVGPTGGGKSSNWKLLKKSLSDLNDGQRFFTTKATVINPKAVRKPELYCDKDPMNPTEWINGIMPYLVNDLNKDTSGKTKYWILFDGPVDTFWIEDMNSVLDDSRRLCLPSSAIIVLNETITMMFEVEDLVHASPATVSRCGMVFMEPGAIGLFPLVESWLQNRLPLCIRTSADNDIVGRLRELFTISLEDHIGFIRKKVKEPCPTTDVNLTGSLMRLLDCFLEKFKDSSKNTQLELDLAILHKNINFLYFFCTVWSIGITSSEEGRAGFNTYLREFMQEKMPEDIAFPAEGTVYDYFFDYENDQWKSWESILTYPPIEARAEYTDIIIPTIDSVRYNYIIKLLLVNGKHLITTGPTGTGKTVNMMEVISRQMGEKYIQLVINFSAQTTASQTQLTIDRMLKRKARGKFAPDNNKTMIVFVDDLNMPKKEKYEAQPPIEILRQWLDYEGWYDIREKEKPFMTVMNLMITGAMGPPGGGRSYLTNRFMRHFNLITYTELVDSSIKAIFERKVNNFLGRFSTEAKNLVPSIVNSTLVLYKEIKDKLLPIPKSSHYLFNLRDMSKVLQGVCSASTKHTTKKIDMVRIWLHEMIRSFGDRLICTEDRTWLKEILDKNIRETTEFDISADADVYNGVDKMIFCDFIGGSDRPYIQVTNVKDFITKIEDKLQEFNEIFKNKAMPLVMFLDACDHVARISRIIRQTQGHALLLGVGGSGRQSIARLSSYINYSMDCTTIEVIKGYKINDFRKNVKDFLKESGVKKKQNCFLICDTQIFDEIMLEDINNCLNSGDIPDIYKPDDLEEIKDAVKTDMKAKGLADNQTNMMTVYLKRVLANIHMIIAMSPVGDQFVTRLRMFPSLVNCCTIDWFTEWPEEALKSVAKDILEKRDDIYLGKAFDGSIDTIKYIHKTVEKISITYLNELRRYNYLTPTSFLEFLSLFQNILLLKTKENEQMIQRYDMGLKVLQFAEENISIIEQEIKRSEPKLQQLSRDTEILVKDLEVKKKEADKVRDKASKDSEVAEELATKISKIEAECRRELSKAEAELQSSLAKIDQIKDNELREVARYQNYGEKLIKTLEVILTFKFGDAWRKKKENLTEATGDPKNPYRISYKQTAINDLNVTEPEVFKEYFYSFKNEARREDLKNNEFDKVQLTEQLIAKNNVTTAMVNDASKAIVPCFEFILGMIEFCHKSIEIVDPKKKEAEKAKVEKVAADEKLAIAQAALNKAVSESAALEKKYNDTLKEKNSLAATLRENQIKVTRAKQLVALLSSEKARWGESVKKLQDYSNYLIGDCIIGAAGIAYCGPFVSTYRKTLETNWIEKLDKENILRSQDVSLRSVMEDPIKTRKWNLSMLPNDNLSIENGIIMFKTSKWPLMIDPQNQASIFLKKYGHDQKATSFQPVKITDPKMVDYVISGVKYGSWIMLDNVGLNLDNSLEPILLRQQVKNKFSNFYEIKIGDKVIPYSEEFRLFMVTTMSNPHYSPETFAKITIINFAITEIGLEDQMLSELVRIERPDLEESKNKILEENFINQESLKKIEDQILENLSNNKDNIEETLKSNELIEILTESKNKSKNISEKMIESEKTGKEIDKGRETYRHSAKRASLLFFSLIDLAMIDPMYQFSLIQFKHLYENCVRVLPPCEDMDKRINDINQATTKVLYDFTCRSLFERDKALYSFMMTVKIIIGEQDSSNIKIKQNELRFLLAGPSSDMEVSYPNNPTTWISPNDWKTFYLQMKGMTYLGDAFKGIDEDFMKNHQKFFEYYETPKNENSPLPEPYESKLTDFQKLLIIKAVRFDKLTNGLAFFVENNLGKEYTEPPTFNLQKSFADSNKEIPLLFVLTTGSDPKNDFQQLADSMNIKVEYVSLGKSMDKYAMVKIDEMKLKGGWILLQNCHLAISFMPQLEDVIEKLQNNATLDNNFRLWLTSMSSNKFSINVLKSAIKITMEPPKGLKLNLQRQYDNIPAEELEGCSKPELFKSFFFGLCFFHAIVQDRRKFGPIGWNVKYDFTNEDLKVSRMQLKNFLEEYDDVPYKVLNYLVAEINYGGRVTDDKDQRLIKTILLTYLTPSTLEYETNKYSSSGLYFCPKPGSKTDYLNYIKNLPLTTLPEVFGMHENAEIITAQNEARLLLETMLLMQPRTSSGSGKTPEMIVGETLAIVEQNTPPPFDYEAIFSKFPTEYTESMNTVLIQEVIRYNVLLNIMKTNIKNLNLALSGRIVMNDELDRIFTSLYNNQVPTIWITSGFLSLKPLRSWIEDLKSRIEFFNDWYGTGTPKCFCLPRFSFPQAFLTGTLQNYARKHGCEIDLLSFEFIILDTTLPENVTERPEDGCLVHGMFLEGAKWNYNNHLLDVSNNRELYTDVPMIHMIPKVNREPPKTGVYNAPLYKVLSRQGTLSTTGHSTNFVLMVEMPSEEEESVWTKAGVAMFLALKQ